jgi:hypothetical protein
VAVPHGVFVNWLAVANSGHDCNHYGSSLERFISFQRMQSNIGLHVCIYYLHHGYQRAPNNTLASIKDLLPVGSFDNISIHFVTGTTQLMEKYLGWEGPFGNLRKVKTDDDHAFKYLKHGTCRGFCRQQMYFHVRCNSSINAWQECTSSQLWSTLPWLYLPHD